MIALTLIACALPILVGAGTADSTLVVDSLRPAPASLDTLAQPRPAVPVPDWSLDLALGGGVVAVDFPERSRFVAELSNDASTRKWTVGQPYGGSDLGPRLEAEIALRRRQHFRLATGVIYQGWSSQAIAQDTSGKLYHRSYGSDLFLGSLGGDLLIAPSILRLDGGKDASIGLRWLVGTGRLEGNGTAWGLANGISLRLGAEFLTWRRAALAAHLGIDWLTVSSNRTWSDLLWGTQAPDKASWSGGGLSLGVQWRWGAPRDTAASAQKK